jgi:hypothetical protein
MSEANIAALKALFSPPPVGAGTVTTAQMQEQELLALATAKLAQFYSMIQLPVAQVSLQTVNAEISANPAGASEALRAEQLQLQAEVNQYQIVLDEEYLTYTNNVEAWYENMTSGSTYVPLDQWPEAQLSGFPNLSAVMAKVTF